MATYKICLTDDLAYSWITLNELAVVVDLGHKLGIHAPGIQYEKIANQTAPPASDAPYRTEYRFRPTTSGR